MSKFLVLVMAIFALGLAGCSGDKATGSTAPLTDEEKAKIAAESKAIEDEESPNNKTRIEKKKK